LFHYPAVSELISSHEANRVDGTDRLLALINLEIWSRMYLDGRTPNDVTSELKVMLAPGKQGAAFEPQIHADTH
jgi:asparagine synthase (glutamine-hydrolysing)